MKTLKLDPQEKIDLEAFLRELVQIPSPSGQEDAVAERIKAEMMRLGFRNVHADRMGNVVGYVGAEHGLLLLLDGHMDTVPVSDPHAWTRDPFAAEVEDGLLYGPGACDMKGGLAAMIYGAKLLQNAGIPLRGGVAVACVVQEEPCEGLGARALIEEEGIHPQWVMLGEPTDLQVSRGQRGRLEVRLVTYGRSAHAACPHLGDNAIYTAARLVFGLELLADQLGDDEFLGPGTLAVTDITAHAGSRNTIPDHCELIIDRRLTLGENETMALAEIQKVIARENVQAQVEVSHYQGTSYTGHTCRARASYPPWLLAEDHPLVATTARAIREQTKRRPQVGCWDFSTDGVYTAGVAGIPTVGFGPGDPHRAHTSDEHVRLADIHTAAEVYARVAAELLKAG